MKTKILPTNVYIEYALCECGEVLVKNTDIVLTTYPIKYIYTCPKCGYRETSHDDYPKITYKEKRN